MRISIWQQWASNHSAGFTMVGEFKSVGESSETVTSYGK
jgi:hypothetical protein